MNVRLFFENFFLIVVCAVVIFFLWGIYYAGGFLGGCVIFSLATFISSKTAAYIFNKVKRRKLAALIFLGAFFLKILLISCLVGYAIYLKLNFVFLFIGVIVSLTLFCRRVLLSRCGAAKGGDSYWTQ